MLVKSAPGQFSVYYTHENINLHDKFIYELSLFVNDRQERQNGWVYFKPW